MNGITYLELTLANPVSGVDTYEWFLNGNVYAGDGSSNQFDTDTLSGGDVISLWINRGAAVLEAQYTVLESDVVPTDDTGESIL